MHARVIYPSYVIKIALFLLLFSLSVRAQSATVNWGTTYQVIDGFGASNDVETAPLTPAQADLFFSTANGVGLSLLRVSVPDDGSCTSVSSACAGTIQDMRLAASRGAKVWAAPWSPPASMKTNGSVDCTAGSGNGALISSSYGAYATYLSNFIASLAGQGISLYALSVQNEPDYCASYDSALWTAQNIHDFVGNSLGPALASAGQTSVKVILPETSQWAHLPTYANTTFQDSSAAKYVNIAASHDYDSFNCSGNPSGCTYGAAQSLGKKLWETEVSSFGAFDPSMSDALYWGQEINDWMVVANANAWHYWWLIGYYNNDNEGLVTLGGTVSKRLYVMGNYSKFVRPGYLRIDATTTPQGGVSVSAYKNTSTGDFAIVVINQNGSSVSQTFSMNGFSAATVTPWVTSSSLNLAQQSNIAVSGGAFSYTLPADSVTTFVGVATNAAGNATVEPPTNLTATVH